MDKTILISLPVEDLQTLIIDCVNVCLKHSREDNTKEELSDTFLTVKQAAEFLHLSVPTIYGLVHSASIPVSKKGKRLYFSKLELTEWIKAGRKKTQAETDADATQYLVKKGRSHGK